MKVAAEIRQIELEGEFGPIDSVEAECARCGHCTESFGTHGASVRRCLVLLREECPREESNFYEAQKKKGGEW
jgi:hypothetical protein